MDQSDLDARIAQAISSAKNQTPIPAIKSPMTKKQQRKLSGNTPPVAAPAPAPAPAASAPAVAVVDPFDLFDSLMADSSAAPAAAPASAAAPVQNTPPQAPSSPVKPHAPPTSMSLDDTHPGGKGSQVAKSPVKLPARRERGYSQDIIKQRVESESPGNPMDVGIEAVVRRTTLISGMEAESVNFQSSYAGRHISPSVKGNRSRSGSGTFTGDSACSLDGTTETAARSTHSPLFQSELAVASFMTHGRVETQQGPVDAETVTGLNYRNKIGAALTSELMEKLGQVPPENPWTLDRKDAPATVTRDVYVPKESRVHRTDNIQVALRVRPFSKEEVASGERRCVSLCDDHRKLVLVNPSVPVFEVDKLAEAVDAEASFSKDIATVHTFDEMFWSAKDKRHGTRVADNQSLHADIGEKLVDSAMKGISSVCFAYGEAKSGKTFSLYGADAPRAASADANGGSMDGLLAKSFSEIVEQAHKLGDTKCTLSFVEIYNEKIHDLLGSCKISTDAAPQGNKHAQISRSLHGGAHGVAHEHTLAGDTHKDVHINSLVFRSTHHRRHSARIELKVREHPLLGPYIDGMKRLRVKSTADVLAVVQEAQAERAWLHEVCNTNANCGTVLATLELSPLHDPHRHAKDSGGLQRGHRAVRVHMVDLAAAPSESISAHWRTSVKTASKPSLMTDKVIHVSMNGRAAVNTPKVLDGVKVVRRSLAHLNYILHSLERGALMHLLPFRDSVLTWLLRSTLVQPSSRIAMIAHISPGERNYEETCRSIKYAERLCTGRTQRSAWAPEEIKWGAGGPLPRSLSSSKVSPKSASATPNTARFSTSLRAPVNLAASTGASNTAPTRKRGAAYSTEAVRKLDERFVETMAAASAQTNEGLWEQSQHRSASLQDGDSGASPFSITESLPTAPLVTINTNDAPEVASLKNTVLALQKTLEHSHQQRQAEKAAWGAEFEKLAERLHRSQAKEQALMAELELMDSVLLEAAGEVQPSPSSQKQKQQRNLAAPAPAPAPAAAAAAAAAAEPTKTYAQIDEVRMRALAMHRKQQLLQEQQNAEEHERRAVELALREQEEDNAYLEDIIEEEEEGEDDNNEHQRKFNNTTPSKAIDSKGSNAPDSDPFGYRIATGADSPGSTDADVSPPRTAEVAAGFTPGTDIDSGTPTFSKVKAKPMASDDDIESSLPHSPVLKSVVRKFVNREEDAEQYKPVIDFAQHTDEHIEAAAAPLEHIGDSELDEQIAKLSKFLVRDKNSARDSRPRRSRESTPDGKAKGK